MLRSILSIRPVVNRSLSLSVRSAAEQPSKEEIDELFADDTKPKVFRGYSRNSVEIIGDVTEEPMRKVTMKDHPYALFQVVTNSRFRAGNGEYKDMNEVHTVQVFGKRLEFTLNRVKKGQRVCVNGRLRYFLRDGVDGRSNKVARIDCDHIHIISGRDDLSE